MWCSSVLMSLSQKQYFTIGFIAFSIWSHLLKKSLMENFIFCAVCLYLFTVKYAYSGRVVCFANYFCFPDIDECATNTDQCSINAICTNLLGGYSCRCKDFYTGNGFVCNGKYKTVDKCFHKSERKFILQDIFWIDLNFDFVILIDTLNWLTA